MQRRAGRTVVCVLLMLPQLGCRSVYRFRCTSSPPGAGVLVGQEMLGATACSLKIPKDSDLIRDGKIEFTFCLPDGRAKKRMVDLRGPGVRPTNPLAEMVAAPFLLAGVGLLVLSGDGNDQEDSFSAEDRQEDQGIEDRAFTALLGLGALGMGGGVYHLFGGAADSLSDYPVRVDFNEPEGRQRPPGR